MASQGMSRQAMADEITFLLSLTNTFSTGFRVKRNRARQWQFLGVALDLEKDGVIPYADLLACERLKTIIEPNRRAYNVYYWVTEFADDFRNDDGPLVDTIHKPAKEGAKRRRIHGFQLNGNYARSAQTYLSNFASKNCPECLKKVSKFTDVENRRVFKEIFQYQTAKYLPHWDTLVKRTSAVAKERGFKDANMSEALISGTNWVVLFLLFKEYLLPSSKQWEEVDINAAAAASVVFVDRDELRDCLETFSSGKGGHILSKTKLGSHTSYLFNKDYEGPLTEYARAAAPIRRSLQKLFKASIPE